MRRLGDGGRPVTMIVSGQVMVVVFVIVIVH
jgi:hypothetical protein